MATGISAVIITHNEAHNIGRCLASLKPVADELIVVDSGSTDGTADIAEQAGARVFQRDWKGFSAQKNEANSLATQPYILSMDSDEALSPELEKSLLQVKTAGATGAYGFARLTNYCGTWVRHGGWYPDRKVRLFPKEGTRWEGEHVHETLALPKGCTVHWLKGDLLHYSYHSRQNHIDRIERYSTLHAEKMKAEGKGPNAWKPWLSPIAKFVQGYLLQGGFLDGSAGWHIARLSAWAVHLKYCKLNALLADDRT
ncbi:MAG: glycosyltransferase family 2 protein [Flavobacteriales bacterium]|nr:glycosyltransferase family 2 protein [Flavobacteriales bacterium]